MKSLLKIMLCLALVFASTFVIAKLTGVLTVENIRWLLSSAQAMSPWVIFAAVALLLFADLFVAIPTLTTILLAGFFLGASLGAAAALLGLYAAGVGGYLLSYLFGEKVLRLVIKDPKEIAEARESFQRHGFVTILLSRAMPILPEVSACMAGITRMPFWRFLLAWSLSVVPYALIAAYAGSISSVDDPKPAILTAIGLSVFFWTAWAYFQRQQTRSGQKAQLVKTPANEDSAAEVRCLS
ncbi:MAG: VTT domain-containing protein [Pseudomonadota bacterium]